MDSSKSFRWGILGTGYIARKFALGLNDSGERMHIAAVCSRTLESAQQFADEFGIGSVFTDLAELLTSNTIDAIYIATPPALHYEQARQAIEAGCPTLVEKPFCVNAEEAESLANTARKNKVFCMEAMWTRFLPIVQHLKSIVDAGELGNPQLIFGNFCLSESSTDNAHLFNPELGGGVLLDRAVYPISLAAYLLGGVNEVSAHVTCSDTGLEEQAAITVRYKNNCLGQFTASFNTQANNNFSLMGSKAMIELDAPIFRPSRLTLRFFSPGQRPPKKALTKIEKIKESHWLHRAYQFLSPVLNALPRGSKKTTYLPYSGNGYGHQALEVMQCVQAGQSESQIMPLSDSIEVLAIVDQLRKSGQGNTSNTNNKIEENNL